ncbi:MAG: mscM [Caulobacteraceae bacterium]|nr:mscM [Caulobacteraceae bacterium]
MRLVVLLLLWLALAAPGRAQVAAPPAPDPAAAVLAQARSDLRDVTAGLQARTLPDSDIESRLARIPPIQARLGDVLSTLTPRQQNLKARLAQLGSPPAAGQPPEDPQTVQLRRDLARRLATVNGEVAQARLLTLTADQISAELSDRLRGNFAARLWTRTRSILDPLLWRDFAGALPGDIARLARAADEEGDQAAPVAKKPRSLAIVVLAVLGGLILVGPARVFLNRLGYRRAARAGGPPRLRRMVLALWLVLVATLTPLFAGLLIRAALIEVDALTPDMAKVTALLIQVSVFAAFLAGLGRAMLSPGRPEWRLAPVPETIVARLAPFPGLIGTTAALSTFFAGLNTLLGASLSSRIASDCLTLLIEMAAVGGALAAVGRARLAGRALNASPSAADAESRAPWLLATLAAWIALVVALVALLVGYLALASFLMRETVWIGAVLALLSLLLRLADDLFPTLLSPASPVGGALETTVGLSRSSLEQLGVLLSGLARLLLLLLAWAAALAPFGASADDILRRFTATNFVVKLGLVAISPGAILGGIALFLAGLFITRAIRRWLEVRYLPKTGLDVGLRTSLAAGVTYLGALIAILAAFAYLGLSVAQIALFASALSVGIGFGLQAIIGNFVSGLILLAERPIRVGDWIAIGDLEGDVRKISIRATEIEMMDRSRLIVPNSELVSKIVRNVTHLEALGRVRIVLKVDVGADPAQVSDIVMHRLRDHPEVLAEPAPVVFMTDARDGALEFTAFGYLTSPRQAYAVKSELLFQIVPDLKAANIGLASQASTVRVVLDAAAAAGAEPPAAEEVKSLKK